jgi:hypothetical protein
MSQSIFMGSLGMHTRKTLAALEKRCSPWAGDSAGCGGTVVGGTLGAQFATSLRKIGCRGFLEV